MSTKLLLDRFTNQSQTVSGTLIPSSLARLKPFLANLADAAVLLEGVEDSKKAGEIRYTLSGNVTTDAAGRRTRRVKCIISGWFLLSDPETFEPEPYELSIKSTLVLVNSESELPPLEEESEDEDFVALGEELDVEELVEEEILLDLPFWAIAFESPDAKAKSKAKLAKQTKSLKASQSSKSSFIIENVESMELANAEPKLSPFAKLADLKKGKAKG
jgi:uncharacterized metal-binding protein YceD (DUF177 family)